MSKETHSRILLLVALVAASMLAKVIFAASQWHLEKQQQKKITVDHNLTYQGAEELQQKVKQLESSQDSLAWRSKHLEDGIKNTRGELHELQNVLGYELKRTRGELDELQTVRGELLALQKLVTDLTVPPPGTQSAPATEKTDSTSQQPVPGLRRRKKVPSNSDTDTHSTADTSEKSAVKGGDTEDNSGRLQTKKKQEDDEDVQVDRAEKITFKSCCGIGHRMARVLPTLVYAKIRGKEAYGSWYDVSWNEIFNDTDTIKQQVGDTYPEVHDNGYPEDWDLNSTQAEMSNETNRQWGKVEEKYQYQGPIFSTIEAYQVINTLRQSLSARVMRKLNPIIHEYETRKLRFAVHFRLGNNETGDWAAKEWRHVDDYLSVLNSTLQAMIKEANGEPSVGVFVASDSSAAAPYFREHVPESWRVITQDAAAGKNLTSIPKQGVWFGEMGSETSKNLTQEELAERMAEGFADVFALGERVDALFIPTYSSFTFLPILLTKSRNKPILFRDGLDFSARW